eukprot:2993778-Pyramimonas_sp.AAC.1
MTLALIVVPDSIVLRTRAHLLVLIDVQPVGGEGHVDTFGHIQVLLLVRQDELLEGFEVGHRQQHVEHVPLPQQHGMHPVMRHVIVT